MRNLETCILSGGLAMATFLLPIAGCGSNASLETSGSAETADAALQASVTAFCGACHNSPDPATFPKDAWYKEVEQGFQFYYESGRADLKPPPMQDVVKWFRDHAPETLELPQRISTENGAAWTFRETHFLLESAEAGGTAGVSNLRFMAGDLDVKRVRLAVCDMSINGLFQIEMQSGMPQVSRVAELPHPAHVEVTDLDADGQDDFLAAILGSFLPQDHDKGQVVWLRGNSEAAGGFDLPVPLLKDVGRVADVQPGDFDGDGDLDLIVAEFGWRKTGRILFLRQVTATHGVPEFSVEVADRRHGAIHVPATDLDHDGDLDFVALISQEFEEISAFLNRGDGVFERQVIHLSGDPSYGSSGIQLVDFDRDGDVDILYSNGDVLDSDYLKPYHGIHWLENRQDFPFQYHRVAELPGASRAQAVDMDRDGDLDVVASAWISDRIRSRSAASDGLFDTLVLIEQAAPDRFIPHSLKKEASGGYMTLDLGELNFDGMPDIVAGRTWTERAGNQNWIDLFENGRKASH